LESFCVSLQIEKENLKKELLEAKAQLESHKIELYAAKVEIDAVKKPEP